jgi:hypothetical protein
MSSSNASTPSLGVKLEGFELVESQQKSVV